MKFFRHPPFATQLELIVWRTRSVLVIATQIVFVAALFDRSHHRSGAIFAGAIALIAVISWGSLFARYRARNRGLDILITKNFRTCIKCHYDFEGLPDTGQCPECGHSYSPGSLEEEWLKAYQQSV